MAGDLYGLMMVLDHYIKLRKVSVLELVSTKSLETYS